eukprot:scaffold625_cov420-Prasinococcus_capsulatus_cf.AAC.66
MSLVEQRPTALAISSPLSYIFFLGAAGARHGDVLLTTSSTGLGPCPNTVSCARRLIAESKRSRPVFAACHLQASGSRQAGLTCHACYQPPPGYLQLHPRLRAHSASHPASLENLEVRLRRGPQFQNVDEIQPPGALIWLRVLRSTGEGGIANSTPVLRSTRSQIRAPPAPGLGPGSAPPPPPSPAASAPAGPPSAPAAGGPRRHEGAFLCGAVACGALKLGRQTERERGRVVPQEQDTDTLSPTRGAAGAGAPCDTSSLLCLPAPTGAPPSGLSACLPATPPRASPAAADWGAGVARPDAPVRGEWRGRSRAQPAAANWAASLGGAAAVSGLQVEGPRGESEWRRLRPPASNYRALYVYRSKPSPQEVSGGWGAGSPCSPGHATGPRGSSLAPSLAAQGCPQIVPCVTSGQASEPYPHINRGAQLRRSDRASAAGRGQHKDTKPVAHVSLLSVSNEVCGPYTAVARVTWSDRDHIPLKAENGGGSKGVDAEEVPQPVGDRER